MKAKIQMKQKIKKINRRKSIFSPPSYGWDGTGEEDHGPYIARQRHVVGGRSIGLALCLGSTGKRSQGPSARGQRGRHDQWEDRRRARDRREHPATGGGGGGGSNSRLPEGRARRLWTIHESLCATASREAHDMDQAKAFLPGALFVHNLRHCFP